MRRIFVLLVLLGWQTISFAADIRLLALSDIHFDPYITCYGKRGSCPIIQALQNAPASQWAGILAEYNKQNPTYREDTGYPLLASTLKAAKQAAAVNHVQFVLILGDFLGHDYKRYFKQYSSNYSRANYHDFVKKTLVFLNSQLKQTFPDIDVYSVVGNNDSYSADYGYYPHTGFFSDTASLWSSLINNTQNRSAMRQQFGLAGYYSVNLSPAVRLISLNSVLFSPKANGKNVTNAANAELVWLEKQLKTAKENHQKVIIAMHIPPVVDIFASLKFRLFRMLELWRPGDIDRYDIMLQTFAPEIMAIFAGHLHVDLMQVLKLSNKTKALGK